MVKTRAVDLRSLPELKERLDEFMEDKSIERMILKSTLSMDKEVPKPHVFEA